MNIHVTVTLGLVMSLSPALAFLPGGFLPKNAIVQQHSTHCWGGTVRATLGGSGLGRRYRRIDRRAASSVRPSLLSLSSKYAQMSDEDLLEHWWRAAQEGNADQIKEIASEEPGMMNLVQTNDSYLVAAAGAGSRWASGTNKILRDGMRVRVLDTDAEKGYRENLGMTALHIGCMFGHTSLVSALIILGASTNTKNEESNAPLHLAVMGGKTEIVQNLLKNGADKELENDMGDTPQKMADMMASADIKACFAH